MPTCVLGAQWRDIWKHESHPWPQRPHTLEKKTEDRNGGEQRHLATRVGTGHWAKSGEGGVSQALFLPTRIWQ